MSSSQANASARRRRAAPPPTSTSVTGPNQPTNRRVPVGAPNVNNSGPTNQIPNSQRQSVQGPRQPLTPPQMLISHEKRLTELEQFMPELTSHIQDVDGSSWENALSQLNERINEVEQKVQGQQFDITNENESTQEQPETIEFFKNKISEIEKQFVKLKHMIIKVQTFSMETNLTLMKYKNGMDADLASSVKESHQRYDEQLVNNSNTNSIENDDEIDRHPTFPEIVIDNQQPEQAEHEVLEEEY